MTFTSNWPDRAFTIGNGAADPLPIETPPKTPASVALLIRGRGRDPLTLTSDQLAAAGHPKLAFSTLRSRFCRTAAGNPDPDLLPLHIRRVSQVRAHCTDCAGSPSERRACAVTCCPLWPYRNGKSPHDPRAKRKGVRHE